MPKVNCLRRIAIVGTLPGSGKGGIASASFNAKVALQTAGYDVYDLISHEPGAGRLKSSFLFSIVLIRVLYESLHGFLTRNRAIFLFQLGPKGSLIRKLILSIVAKACGAKVLVHYHSPIFELYISAGGLYGHALLFLAKIADVNFVLSDWWLQLFRQNGVDKIAVLPNCVRQEAILRGCPVTPEKTNILVVARLVKEKNVDQVLSAMKYLPENFFLTVAGDGPHRLFLESVAQDMNLTGRVSFLGWIGSSDRSRIMSQSDLFVLPTKYDSFGMVFLESLVLGLPVIYGNNPAVHAVLENLPGAHCLDSDFAEDLAKKIMEVVSENTSPAVISKSLLDSYGENCFVEKFEEGLIKYE